MTFYVKAVFPAISFATIGFLSGVAWQFDLAALQPDLGSMTLKGLTREAAIMGFVFALFLVACQSFSRIWIMRVSENLQNGKFWLLSDGLCTAILLMTFVGGLGVRFDAGMLLLTVLLFLVGKGMIALYFAPVGKIDRSLRSGIYVSTLFVLSGFAALIYQLVWQRYFLVLLGVNVESVTLVVSVFMGGLGLGAMIGGRLSLALRGDALLKSFVACELSIGLLGCASPSWFTWLEQSVSISPLAVSTLALCYLALATLLMGVTLPLLVAYLKRMHLGVGEAVGMLYFGSTLGSAFASFFTAHLLFRIAGLQAVVMVAVAINLTIVVLTAFVLKRMRAPMGGHSV